jgi:hypothetical protein
MADKELEDLTAITDAEIIDTDLMLVNDTGVPSESKKVSFLELGKRFLIRVGGIVTGLIEEEVTINVSAGVDDPTRTATIDYGAQGLTIIPNTTKTLLALGAWPESGLESMTIQIVGQCDELDYSDAGMQGVIGVADLPSFVSAGPIQFEMWRMFDGAVGSYYFIKQTVAE